MKSKRTMVQFWIAGFAVLLCTASVLTGFLLRRVDASVPDIVDASWFDSYTSGAILPSQIERQSKLSGGRDAAYIDADGNLWAWGGNAVGQIGDGTRITRQQPVRVLGPFDPNGENKKAVAVAAGS